MERLSPNVPANAKVVHSTPAVTLWRTLRSRLSAKLKMIMTSRENTSMAEINSKERYSAWISFQTMAKTARRKDGLAATSFLEVLISSMVLFILSSQGFLVEGEQVTFLQLVAACGSRNDPA